MEPALVDAFVERIEKRLAERQGESEQSLRRKREHQKEMVLGAMALSIPLFALAAIFTGPRGRDRRLRRARGDRDRDRALSPGAKPGPARDERVCNQAGGNEKNAGGRRLLWIGKAVCALEPVGEGVATRPC